MVFPVVGGTQDTAYEIGNSLRFNDGDSPSLQFTPSSDSNEQTWTVSFWVKRGVIGTSSSQMIFASDTNYDEYVFCRFCGTEVTNKTDMFQVFMVEPNSREGNVRTTRLFRDPSAWYHIVVRCDLTQGTAADRLRIYVNGVKETSFDTASYLNQNDDNVNWNSNVPQAIGHQKQASSVERHLDGYLSDFYNIDGTSLGPDSFGETNDNGVWIPKKYTGSYGTNGYKLEFKQTGTSANASGMGADTSGNDHHWTPANLAATDVTTDTPTNNFCTMNPLDVGANLSNTVFSEGNCKLVKSGTTSNNGDQVVSTMGFANGKWYWEIKGVSNPENMFWTVFTDVLGGQAPYHNNYAYSMYGDGNGSNSQIYESQEDAQKGYGIDNGTCFSNNDIIQMAFDADNYRLYIGRNGSWVDDNAASGGTITSGSGFNESSPTGYYQISTAAAQAGFYRFAVVIAGSSVAHTTEINFGNPSFSISSGNSDANGYGNFEYSVPSGYYALCTKNLAEYG